MLYIVEENGEDGTHIELFDGKKFAEQYAVGLVLAHMAEIWGEDVSELKFKNYQDAREYADNLHATTREIRRIDAAGIASIAIYEAVVNSKKTLSNKPFMLMQSNYMPKAEGFEF